jgi:pimeloyl-ACP methyl ester carboxylesterase
MTSFVLVHASRHGGWSWSRVAPLLRAAGHDVHTPTLTGLGERRHLASPEVDLSLHVEDVVNVILFEELHDVVLVGHSYGGMVVTGVAERLPGRIAHIVYLDALVPTAGQSAWDIYWPERVAALRAAAREQGDGWRVPAGRLSVDVYGLDPADAEWIAAKLTDQPIRTYEEKLVSAAEAERVPRTFVDCTAVATMPPAFRERALSDPGWRLRELAAGHEAPLTHPGEVARLLLEV